MRGEKGSIAKPVGIFLLIMAPYAALIVTIGLTQPRGNAARALALFALVYMVFGGWLFIKILKREANVVSPRKMEHAQEIYGRPDFPPLKINTAWISSAAHLARFQDLSWSAKTFGNVPDDFPTLWLESRRYPILYFASGTLIVDPNRLVFAAHDPSTASKLTLVNKVYSNLNDALRFTLTPEQILSVARFDMSQVGSFPMPLPFLHVQASAGDISDFLVCAGSDDPSEIGAITEDLYVALQSFTAERKGVLVPS